MPRQRVLKLNYFDLLLFVVDLFILLKASLLNKNPRQIEVTDFERYKLKCMQLHISLTRDQAQYCQNSTRRARPDFVGDPDLREVRRLCLVGSDPVQSGPVRVRVVEFGTVHYVNYAVGPFLRAFASHSCSYAKPLNRSNLFLCRSLH